ncbi:uncharacterized protein MKZ38_008548 [Zalerion maritima]|uniref:Repressor of RNA polymerase III transcription MAF1 n=1 Tax=Zalerion maritima TaxID=339359 RepID=A0AAD5RU15_9PEZI|nr:uncharacterized protein MKZ38_008548 [Zalerion maritima]
MKFLPLRELSIVSGALNFDTPDCHVTGSCDLYTTKAAGSDKKLYKSIDKSLESQQASIAKLGASLSPPQREQMAASLNLSRSSPFGPLTEMASRRIYAYLIATLNASHSDYDFSHTLRPTDFKLEKNLKAVISMIDSTLTNVRAPALNGSIPRSYGDYYSSPLPPASHMGTLYDEEASPPTWGPQMWAKIDKEMEIKNCQIFSYQPAEDPFEEDEPAVWSFHYFFFNKAMKRVVYVYARGVPVLSHSPNLRPRRIRRGSSGIVGGPASGSRSGSVGVTGGRSSSFGLGMGSGGAIAGLKRGDTDEFGGSSSAAKRARFWLGDRVVAEHVGGGVDDENEAGDGFVWNRDEDGEVENWNQYGVSDGFEDDDDDSYDDEDEEDSDSEMDDTLMPHLRGVSEDVAGRMELD